MRKPFLILILLVLFGSCLDQVAGQVTSTKTQPPTNVKNPKSPVNSAPMVVSAPAEQNAAAKGMYQEGMILAERGEFPQAAEHFQEALRLDPEYVDAYSALGRAYFKMGEWQKASDTLHRAAKERLAHANAVGVKALTPNSEASRQPELPKETSTAAKVSPASSQAKLSQPTNGNVAGAKTLSPNSEASRQPELPKETSAPAKVSPASSQPKLSQPTNANVAGVKTLSPNSEASPQPEPRKEISTPAKVNPTSSQAKLAQPTNANVAGVKTLSSNPEPARQPEPRKETSTPGSAGYAQIKTNADVAGVKTLSPNPETSRAHEPRKETSTPGSAGYPQIKPPQETNANGAGVKAVLPQSQTTEQPAKAAAGVPLLKSDDNGLKPKQEPMGNHVSNSTPASLPVETKSVIPISNKVSSDEASLTKIYRVGPSDVLDVHINDSESLQSTLFTVTPSGLLEHPMLPEPLAVSGFTVEEIGKKIEIELIKRALPDPKVAVGVRDYASHAILVSGLVKDAGTRFIRREAIPLYVVVADAQPLPEAATVTVVRNELNQMYEIDLRKPEDMNLLVRPGDVVTLHPNVTQFVYLGGEVKFPGEKTYRRGLTLMQTIIAAGGVTQKSKVAEIDRDDGRGFLVGTRLELKDIVSGKTADPVLRPGDRIMIQR